jgi:hypothetical protein
MLMYKGKLHRKKQDENRIERNLIKWIKNKGEIVIELQTLLHNGVESKFDT